VLKTAKVAKKEKIWYIGHSQGSLVAFAGLTEDTCYEKVSPHLHGIIALAPILSLKHVRGPWRSVIPAVKSLVNAPVISPDLEFLPKSKAGRWFAQLGTSSPSFLKEWGSQMTRNFLLQIANFDQKRYVEARLEVFLSHTPAGTSLRNLIHYAQVVDQPTITKFDHGKKRNLILYNSVEPPAFDFSKVALPVHMFVGTEDWLATPEDTVDKVKVLPRSRVTVLENFDHLDFIWGRNAVDQLHPKIYSVLDQSQSSTLL